MCLKLIKLRPIKLAVAAWLGALLLALPSWGQGEELPQAPLCLEGEGNALIFIGGFGDEISGIMHHLAKELPPMSPDAENRAYYHWHLGRADALDEGIAALARRIGEYRNLHPHAIVALIGHSMGAATALKVANALPAGQGMVCLLTLDPADRSTPPIRPPSVSWWGNSHVEASQSRHDFIAAWGGRWGNCSGADLNLAYDGRRQDEAGLPYIHDHAMSLLVSRGNSKGLSLWDALRRRVKGK